MAIPACHNSPCNPPPKFVWSHAMLGRNKSNATLNPGQVDTLIGPQVSIRGDVTFSGGLYVEGRIHGAVCAEEGAKAIRSEEHTSELQSLMRSSYAVFCLKNKQSNKKTIRPMNYTTDIG